MSKYRKMIEEQVDKHKRITFYEGDKQVFLERKEDGEIWVMKVRDPFTMTDFKKLEEMKEEELKKLSDAIRRN